MPRRRTRVLVCRVLVPMLVAAPAHADLGGNAESDPPIDSAMEAIEDREYEKAVEHLQRHLGDNRRDADALNLMGFSLRKLERYDDAEKYYTRALAIEPEHLGANEYLGELYLQTGRPELARERLAVLEAACPEACDERRKLDDAVSRYSNGEGP